MQWWLKTTDQEDIGKSFFDIWCHEKISTTYNWHVHSKFPMVFLTSFRIFSTLMFEATQVSISSFFFLYKI